MLENPGLPPLRIAYAATPVWARHIADALNVWTRHNDADPLSVKCPVFRCERPVGRRCLAIGSQGGMDGPPHRERVEGARKAARDGAA